MSKRRPKNAEAKKSPASFTGAADVLVIGDGWSALAAVGFLVQQGRKVVWVASTGARVLSPMPGLETGPGVELWQRLARAYGIDAGEALSGSFLREYRNKAFREPLWTKAPTPEARQEVLLENVWGPERHLAPLWETRFTLTLNEIECRIRDLLTNDKAEEGAPYRELIRRIEGVPVESFRIEEGHVRGVVLASGEELGAERILFADRWSALPAIQGLPKNLAFIRRREAAAVLQATFAHPTPMGVGLMEGFFNALHKESGEQFERHLWGHFSSDGAQSFWSVCLTQDEAEDNHQIAKKLRRLKNGLEKMFVGTSWLPEDKAEFMANVSSEQVRLQETMIFAEGEIPSEPVMQPGADGVLFLTDGYGPSHAIRLVGQALGLTAPEADAEAESMNRESPPAS